MAEPERQIVGTVGVGAGLGWSVVVLDGVGVLAGPDPFVVVLDGVGVGVVVPVRAGALWRVLHLTSLAFVLVVLARSLLCLRRHQSSCWRVRQHRVGAGAVVVWLVGNHVALRISRRRQRGWHSCHHQYNCKI